MTDNISVEEDETGDFNIELNKVDFTDSHPNKTGVVIERDGLLYLE